MQEIRVGCCGFPRVVACSQGRAAERLWAKMHIHRGSIVPGNMLFPSTRFHIESQGGKVVDVISDQAYDLYSPEPFKGNVDLAKLKEILNSEGREKVPCVYVELCVNACGGHPVSMENLKAIKRFLKPHSIPLFLDASRILENCYLIQRREKGYRGRHLSAISREICDQADACTISGRKDCLVREGGLVGIRDEKVYKKVLFQSFLDGAQLSGTSLETLTVSLAVYIDVERFLPGIPAEHRPAEALAASVYLISGIRMTKGPPKTEDQTARGICLLRLAVPARRYLAGHLEDVTRAIVHAHTNRGKIQGLRRIESSGRSKYEPDYFALMDS